MGTPILDRDKLTSDLAQIIAKPEYRHLLKGKSAYELAEAAVNRALGDASAPNLRDPIRAVELKSGEFPLELYRAYEGVRHGKAGTLGNWWCDKKVLKRVVYACAPKSATPDHGKVIQKLLEVTFVHPSWNAAKDIARMGIPVGASTPGIVGVGDPRAAGLPVTDAESEQQYFLPMFNDMWVAKVAHLSKDWPFE